MCDLVHVSGKVGDTPSVRFSGKANLVSDRMGEKLSEGFVIQVLARLFAEHPPQPSFAMLAPEKEAQGIAYTLYTNAVGHANLQPRLDSLLAQNPNYLYCRRLGQLAPVRVRHVNGDAYSIFCARLKSQGRRVGDIKPAALTLLDGWGVLFESIS
jgi:hypothetical protein